MKKNIFWIAFSDLMTSLFFIMLILFVVSLVINRQKGEVLADLRKEVERVEKIETEVEKLREIEAVQEALENLNTDYFMYDLKNKRYRLDIDAVFESNSDDINDLGETLHELELAGLDLYNKVDSITKLNQDVDYLLIIEGNTMRSGNNYTTQERRDIGYVLSYRRALSLYNFWVGRGIQFSDFGEQCEVIIAGSGYFGMSRDLHDERNNKNFTIQITAKVGKFIQSSK